MIKTFLLITALFLGNCAPPAYAETVSTDKNVRIIPIENIDKTPGCQTTFESISLIMNDADLKGKVELVREYASEEDITRIKEWVTKNAGVPSEQMSFKRILLFSHVDRPSEYYVVLFQDLRIEDNMMACMTQYFWQGRDQVHEMVGSPDGSL